MKKTLSLILLILLSLSLTACWPFDKKKKDQVNNPSLLNSLTVKGYSLSPGFSAGVYNYNVEIGKEGKTAIIEAEGKEGTTVTGTGEIKLNLDVTVQKVTVTDGSKTEEYTLTINRGYDSSLTVDTKNPHCIIKCNQAKNKNAS